MPNLTAKENLGGRLPLLDPRNLSGARQEIYDLIAGTMLPWSEKAGFRGKTDDGRFIGPFNPSLYSPGISKAFLKLQEIEPQDTTLSERERQVVILTVGEVWQCDYERYAHAAVARQAGLSEEIIRALANGSLPEGLSAREQLARHYARQLCAGRRVNEVLYREAEQALGQRGLVDLAYLVGIYQTVCGLLNSFEIPAPA